MLTLNQDVPDDNSFTGVPIPTTTKWFSDHSNWLKHDLLAEISKGEQHKNLK